MTMGKSQAHVKPSAHDSRFMHQLQAMVATLDMDSVLTQLMELLATCSIPKSLILLFDERQHTLQCRAMRGFSCDHAQLRHWLLSEGGTATIMKGVTAPATEQPVAIISLSPESILSKQEELSSLYCLGLQTEQQLWGAVLFAAAGNPIEEALLNSVIVAGSFAAGAIQNAFQYGQTRLQTITDPLTGLYNKRYFKQSLPHEIARAQRYCKPMTLMMIDIDHFKQLNDIYGHPKGDQVLSTLGSTLHESLRGTDFSFRYGGEEFAVILPETRIEHSFTVAEHLRSTLHERMSQQLNLCGQGKVTASIGLAAFPHDGATSEILLKHADHCLYKAKHQGRNRVYWEMNTMEISK